MGDDIGVLLGGSKILGILRGYDVKEAIGLAERIWNGGVGLIEVSIVDRKALDVLESLVELGRETGHAVGAGTIIDEEQVEAVYRRGATFTVSPGLRVEVIKASLRLGMAHLPGVATASEIELARSVGLQWLKMFPASVLGVDWIEAMLAPFPGTKFVATGGIDDKNAGDFLKAGAAAVAVGSALRDTRVLERLSRM